MENFVDHALTNIGIGKFQYFHIGCMLLPAAFFNGMLQFTTLFMTPNLLNHTTPSENETILFCKPTCDGAAVVSDQSSIGYEAWVLSAGSFSSVIGIIVFGWLSDALSRRWAFLLSCMLLYVFGALRAVATLTNNDLHWFFAINAIHMFPIVANSQLATTIGIEWTPPRLRSSFVLVIGCTYSVGIVSLAGVTYAVGSHWPRLALWTAGPPLIMLVSYWWLLAESPHWLYMKAVQQNGASGDVLTDNRQRQFKSQLAKVLRTAALWNGTLSQLLLNDTELSANEMRPEHRAVSPISGETNAVAIDSWRMLITNPHVRFVTMVLSFIWFCVISTYFGFYYYVPQLPCNKYIVWILLSGAELPCYFIMMPLMYYIGRRALVCGLLMLTGAACLLHVVLPCWPQAPQFMLITFGLAKLGTTSAFQALLTWTEELYPTSLRSTGVAVTGIVGTLGTVLAPFIARFHSAEFYFLPMVLFCALCAVSSFVALFLDETKNSTLPATVEQMIARTRARRRGEQQQTEESRKKSSGVGTLPQAASA